MTQRLVVIPVYNEADTIGPILREVTKALPDVSKQIVIVDDCSNDGTAEWLRRNLSVVQGGWLGISIDDDGELALRRPEASNTAGFDFTVVFSRAKAAQSGPGSNTRLAMSLSFRMPTSNTIRMTGRFCCHSSSIARSPMSSLARAFMADRIDPSITIITRVTDLSL
jgi:cellulose synthase/poly-beta-1,6-N-acetylglucosamine synthase-like glycosyltransferase